MLVNRQLHSWQIASQAMLKMMIFRWRNTQWPTSSRFSVKDCREWPLSRERAIRGALPIVATCFAVRATSISKRESCASLYLNIVNLKNLKIIRTSLVPQRIHQEEASSKYSRIDQFNKRIDARDQRNLTNQI